MCLSKMKPRHVLGVLLLCALSFLFGKTCKKQEIVKEIEVDTVIDTLIQPIPVPEYVVDIGEVEIPLPMEALTKVDTVIDTVYLRLPIERKTYQTDDYRAVISGYRPNLDTMTIYHKREIIYKKDRRWGIGLTAGYGLGRDGFSPYLGAGVYYRIW